MSYLDGLQGIELQSRAKFPELDPNPVMSLKHNGDIVYANPAASEILYYWDCVYAGIPEVIMNAVHAVHHQGGRKVIREEITVKRKVFLFTLIWVESQHQVFIYGTDITRLKLTSQEIIHLARYDSLTRVANRQYFEQKLRESFKKAESLNMAILLIDIDNFKNINDTLGHSMGDKVLQSATKRMLHCLRKDDLIARLGGDEFVILLKNISGKGACVVAENINRSLNKPFQFGSHKMQVSCSIGIALTPEGGNNYTDLLKHADIAMYQAKKLGKNRYLIFSNALYQLHYQRNLAIEKDLKFASAKEELFIEYQPQFHLESGKIFGYEALVRWNHSQLGKILPGEFIPFAEQNGLIYNIGQWIIEQAINDYMEYLLPWSKGHLSINISLPQLTDARFIDALSDSLKLHHFNNENIILDLPEPILNEQLRELPKSLQLLREHGIKLSLDNFGSAEIPFPILLDLPLNYLKFDGAFLKNIGRSAKQEVLLQGLIELSHKLDMEVIQKGVETREQHELLKKMGCSYGQGLYYCKPLKIPDLLKFLEK